jgi:uncharacterized protein
MWAPALGNILTRMLTREGWQDSGLRPFFRQGWKYWLAGWVLPAVLTFFGAAVFFLLFPQFFDSALTRVQSALAATPSDVSISPWLTVALELAVGILIAPILNSLATFGEEFGWRGYLLTKLMPLGGRPAMLILGAIWGIWHWPVIFMGYEYGLNYPGYPIIGPLLFLWITFCFGTFLGWLTLRSKSIWPAVIGHAAINGIAAAAVLATTGQPNNLLGPLPVGIVGSLGYALLAVVLFLTPQALEA